MPLFGLFIFIAHYFPFHISNDSSGIYGSWRGTSQRLLRYSNIEQFNITGTAQNDNLTGFDNADTLQGGAGNDTLKGGAGNDIIIGVNPYTATPGLNEIDIIDGGAGSDRIILGNNTQYFYDDNSTTSSGTGNYARIQNFNKTEDFIQLFGPKTNYRLATSPIGGITGTAIYRVKTSPEPDELIAIIEGVAVADLNLNSSYFVEAIDEIAFSDANYRIGEDGTTNAVVTLTRTLGNRRQVNVTLNLNDGTATAGQDYNNTPIEVIFADGETRKTVLIPLTDDSVYEGNETINLSFTITSSPNGTTTGTMGTATLTIVEEPVINFSAVNYTVNEGGTIQVTVNRTGSTDGQVGATLSLSDGTATYPGDYDNTPINITFAPNETSKTITLAIPDDFLREGNETVNLTLNTPTNGATVGTQNTAVVTITDNDIGLNAEYFNGYFADNLNFFAQNQPVFQRIDKTVNFQDNAASWNLSSVSALADLETFSVRWRGYINIPTTGNYTFYLNSDDASYLFLDNAADSPTTANSSVNNAGIHGAQERSGQAYLEAGFHKILIVFGENTANNVAQFSWSSTDAGLTKQIVPDSALFTLTNVDVPAFLSFNAANYTVNEENGTIDVTVTRTGRTTGQIGATISLTNGTATYPIDYNQNSFVVTFAEGETSKTVTIPIINDTKFEPNETINLALTNFTGGATLGSQSTATLTIISEDLPAPGQISFSNSQFSVNENGNSIVAVTLTRTGGSDGQVTVTLTPSDGTAIAPDDYTSNPITVTFADGETSKTVTIPIFDDTDYEANETVNLTLSNVTGGATLGTQTTATLNIINNEKYPSDLSVESAIVPDTAGNGSSIEISWTVNNQGTLEAQSDWFDAIYLSTNPSFDGLDILITTESISSQTPLAPGANYTITKNVVLPNTVIGNQYLLFVTDRFNNQEETNENNNFVSVPITLTAPNLTILTATTPLTATQESVIPVSWTVTNTEATAANADWSDSIYLSNDAFLDNSDTFITSESITTQTPLFGTDSYTISRNITIPNTPTGNRYLLFVADGSNNQGETDETDNSKAIEITLLLPDLTVSNPIAPTTANLGQAFNVSWTVNNIGSVEAPSDWSDLIYISNDPILDNSDTVIRTETIATQTPLAAGANYTFTRNINLPNTATGNHYLLFVADGNNTQPETDNTNNIQSVAITVNAPDLIVNNITAPVEVISGQAVEISWTVKNQGTAKTIVNWTDRVYLDLDTTSGLDQLLGSYDYNGTLAVGNSITRSQLINIPITLSGNYRVVVITDYNGQILEGTQNESNNTTIDDVPLQIKQAPLPNLQVSNVIAPLTAFSNQNTVITWTVTNSGNGATSAPIWYDGIYLSLDNTIDNTDIFLGNQINSSYLNVGESYTSSRTVTLPRGIDANYYFLVQTDINNNVFEFNNEGDNFGVSNPTDINLTPPPDFVVSLVNAPNNAFSGQPLTLNWTVTNTGERPNSETNWVDDVFMSSDEVLDNSDRFLGRFNRSGTINSGSSYNSTQTVTLPIGISGNYYFFVRTDAGNQVYENVYEFNNTGYDTTPTQISLTPPPDLEVELVNAPTTATAGRNLTITYQVTNFGSTSTPNSSWTDTLYLSSDNQLNVNTDLRLGTVNRNGILAPDGSYTNSGTFTLPNTISGTYYAFVATDSNDVVFELDNNNNTGFDATPINITVVPADLVVAATTSSTAEAGKSLRVEWTVTNQGIGDSAVSNWSDRIIASSDNIVGNGDDVDLGTFARSGLLSAGGSYSRNEIVALPFNLSGRYQVFVVTDNNNNVYEQNNEGNNTAVQTVTITRQTPDLQVTQLNAPTSALSGQPFTVNWTVQNTGGGLTNTDYWYDDVYLSTDSSISNDDLLLERVYRSGTLEASQQYTLNRTFTLPANLQGQFFTLVRTDSTNRVIEDIETNNILATLGTGEAGNIPPTTITLSPVADLVVDNVDAPTTGISGQLLTLSWTVSNTGTAATGTRGWYDAVYLSRDQIFDRNSDLYLGYVNTNDNLGVGNSATRTQSFRLNQGLSGLFYAFVVTDGGNNINERGGEGNNINYDPVAIELSLAQPADLVVGTISLPETGIAGQNGTISYTVTNSGVNPVVGSWTDTIYLSKDTTWDINDTYFGQVINTNTVASGGSYSKTVTAPLPGVETGDYHVILRSDIRNQIVESNEENNLKASLDDFNIDVEELTLGESSNGTLGQGQGVYYRVDVAAGETLRVKLDNASETAVNELYIRYGEVPTRANFDLGFSEPLAADQEIIIPATSSGTYYILAYGNQVSGSPNYQIEAELIQFSVSDISTKQASNKGQATLVIDGAKFSTNDEINLVAADGTLRQATRVWWKDSTELWATFDLQGLDTGLYDIQVKNETQTVSLEDAFTVTNGAVGNLEVNVSAPSALRPGQGGIVTVDYVNSGETDIVAPLLTLVAENADLKLPQQSEASGSSLQFLGISSTGPAGIIAPGQRGSFSVQFAPTVNEGSINFSLSQASNEQVIDWQSLKDQSKPDNVSNEAWEVIWQNFVSSVGNQAGTYQEVLADNATHLSQLGEYTSDALRLLDFELQQVSNTLVGSNQGDAIDDRFTTGNFGKNGVSNWDITATPNSNGDVTVSFGNSRRLFTKQTDGTYKGQSGDNATLTQEGGIYQLREENGTLISFRLDSKFDYIEDSNQNQITASYTDGKLSRLDYTNGDSLTFAYNPQGLVSQTVDQDGRITGYQYDTTGQYLLSITTPDGTTSYTYETDVNSASLHAIKSVTYPDNTSIVYQYDNQGRLIKQSLNSNAQEITYSYDSAGGVTITDASGAISKLLYNDRGTLGRSEDPLQRLTQYQYDINGNLVKLINPDNTVSSFTYDKAGNITSSVNALGQQVKYSYETTYNQLSKVEDSRGNPLSYSYDNRGNLQQITYPDGSKETFTYNADGDVTVSVNRRNETINYTYNSQGLLTRKDFADGTSATYTYDERDNLLSATDSDSSVSYTYDELDRLTKVSYGADRFLEFSYDSAGRRSQMVDQDGFTTNYNYDELGQLESLTDGTGATIITYTYDLVGRLSREENGNGTYTTYSYDLAGQLLSLVNYDADETVNSYFDYTYNLAGRRTSMTTLEGITSYGYDSIGQLTSVTLPNGRLIQYQYDAAGNRIKVSDSGVQTGYSTNNLNQYTSVGGATYSYDADGNLITKTEGANTWTYVYDSENRLVGAATPDGIWSYEYDALGNRVASIHNGERTEYLLDPTGLGDVVGEYTGTGNIIARYTHGLGLVSRVDGTNGASYYDADAIGSIVGLTGNNGSYVNQYSYLPFGESLNKVEAVSNPFEYVGQWGVMREGNSLDFMRARFYDSGIGRFTALDPIGLSGGDTNLYRYVGNSSINYIDPSGLGPWDKLYGLPKAFWRWAEKKDLLKNLKGPDGQISKEDALDLYDDYRNLKNKRPDSKGRSTRDRDLDDSGFKDSGFNNNGFGNSGFEDGDLRDIAIDLAIDLALSSVPKHISLAFSIGYGIGTLINDYALPDSWKKAIENAIASIIDTFNLWDVLDIPIVNSSDPNDIIGPAGFGEENWITASSTLPYTIRFENQATATAPAQQVFITHPLDADLDFRTFRLGDFGWSNLIFDVPDNVSFYNQRLDLTETYGFFVDVAAGIDILKGEAFWTITTIDPETGEIPINPTVGFLPPDTEDGIGDGFVNYTIRPKRNVTTGTVIDAEATIIFDINEPINTPPIFNTLDAGKPSSTLNPLPTSVAPGEFLVSWSGGDDNNGSGIAYYTVYVSDNRSAFTPWLTQTTLTEASYIGEAGHTYAFKVVATDNTGNTQAIPTNADATTQVLETGTNIAPILAANNGLTLDEASTGLITLTQLQVTDTDNSPTELTYTITGLPTQGIILLNGIPLDLNSTFTQADIDNNLLSYAHNGSETPNDSFSFTVSDGAGGAIATTTFNITLNPINDTPVLNNAIADQTTGEGQPFNFTIPNTTFADRDSGDSLSYTLATNTTLPSGVTFDATTGTFSGTPSSTSAGTYNITVIATDTAGASVSDTFTLTVANLIGTNGNDTLTGTPQSEKLEGLGGNDNLSGKEGNDTLDGGTGNDTMRGSIADDVYFVNSSGDRTLENADEGIDTVQASLSWTLGDNLENLSLTGSSNLSGTGNTLNNTITGNSGSNNLNGLDGDDSLIGGGGNDTLNGGAGDDTMIGGVGNDVYTVDSVDDVVVENLNEGTDTVNASVSYTLGENLERLTITGTDNLNGNGNSLNNIIIGNSGHNNLMGEEGNDTFDGGIGDDTLVGGLGNDVYNVDSINDVITENLNEGTDTVNASTSYTLSDNLEKLTLTGTGNINATGNSLNNTLTGNSGNNVLTGLNGNDTLDGKAGDDTLIGSGGNDIYVVDSNGDVVSEDVNAGTDTVNASISYILGDNLERLTLTGTANLDGTGNSLNNTLTGNSGNNVLTGLEGNDTLDGKAGIDTLIGGVGNDTYVVDNSDDVIIEDINAGTDSVNASVSYNLAENLEKLTLTGSNAINGTGNNLNNTLTGNNGNNILSGLDGNDTFDGKGGEDTLIGGSGNDVYTVNSLATVVTENANEGIDTINTSVSLTVADYVENLTLTGSNNLDGTGNSSNNTLTGNTGANRLSGELGNDSLNGGNGDDTLNGGEGNDTLAGGAGNDVLDGGDGDDRLTGGTGADVLTGGGGVNTFGVSSLGDSLLTNFDRINDFKIGTDSIDGPSAVSTALVAELGEVSDLSESAIAFILNSTNFVRNRAATFTFDGATRTFLALNNGTSGFNASADAIIEITGYSGQLTDLTII